MAELGNWQKPIVMPSYPHMLAEDSEVWTEFLKNLPVDIRQVWYDVHVGEAMKLPEGSSELDKKVALGVSRKRIDVVALYRNVYWVIEVKPTANMTALGQVITYRRLFALEYAEMRAVQGVVVCFEVEPDVLDDFQIENIAVFQIER